MYETVLSHMKQVLIQRLNLCLIKSVLLGNGKSPIMSLDGYSMTRGQL